MIGQESSERIRSLWLAAENWKAKWGQSYDLRWRAASLTQSAKLERHTKNNEEDNEMSSSGQLCLRTKLTPVDW